MRGYLLQKFKKFKEKNIPHPFRVSMNNKHNMIQTCNNYSLFSTSLTMTIHKNVKPGTELNNAVFTRSGSLHDITSLCLHFRDLDK